MSDANFYHILGVDRSASADEIKSAYRELVKRYHPDLFPAAGEKAQATAKLRRINEAYAVLGDTERRRRYDQQFVQTARTPGRAPGTAKRSRTSRPRRREDPRPKQSKTLKQHLHFSNKWAGYSVAAAMLVLLLVYAGRNEPRLATAWILLEKLEVSPPQNMSPPDAAGDGWVRVGEYASVSECAAILTEKVRKDEREGSRAVFDEQNATMAITVYVKQDTAGRGGDSSFTTMPERSAADQGVSNDEQRQLAQQAPAKGADSASKSAMTKRVRSLECRETQRVETESRFRRALRSLGVVL